MKTLVVYYSKTGTTEIVAKAIIGELGCDFDEIKYDEKANTISFARDPAGYEHVVLLSPVWAFALAEPMKQYVAKHKANIRHYDLIVTCGALGLRGCVKNCVSAIGKPPENALKFKSKDVKRSEYDTSAVTHSTEKKD